MKSRKKQICQGIGIILALCLITVNAERIPVVGNLIAARRITEYVSTVYEIPILDRYAKYNPVSSSFYIEYEKDGETAIISCDITGNIYDPERTKALIEQLESSALIAKQNEKDERQHGTITCYYEKKDYEPTITLSVGIRESKEPFPASQTDLINKMWERFDLYYSLISEKEKDAIDQVYVSYQHYSEIKAENQAQDGKVYFIQIEAKQGENLTKDAFCAVAIEEE